MRIFKATRRNYVKKNKKKTKKETFMSSPSGPGAPCSNPPPVGPSYFSQAKGYVGGKLTSANNFFFGSKFRAITTTVAINYAAWRHCPPLVNFAKTVHTFAKTKIVPFFTKTVWPELKKDGLDLRDGLVYLKDGVTQKILPDVRDGLFKIWTALCKDGKMTPTGGVVAGVAIAALAYTVYSRIIGTTASNALAQARAQIGDAATLGTLAGDLTAARAQNGTLTAQVATLTNERDNDREEVRRLAAECDRLRTSLDQAIGANSVFKSKLTEDVEAAKANSKEGTAANKFLTQRLSNSATMAQALRSVAAAVVNATALASCDVGSSFGSTSTFAQLNRSGVSTFSTSTFSDSPFTHGITGTCGSGSSSSNFAPEVHTFDSDEPSSRSSSPRASDNKAGHLSTDENEEKGRKAVSSPVFSPKHQTPHAHVIPPAQDNNVDASVIQSEVNTSGNLTPSPASPKATGDNSDSKKGPDAAGTAQGTPADGQPAEGQPADGQPAEGDNSAAS